MPQLSLYLTDEEMAALRKNAKKAGMSLSKYAAQAIEEKNNKKSREWPPGFFDLYGSIKDPSFLVPDDSMLDPSLDDDCDWFNKEGSRVSA